MKNMPLVNFHGGESVTVLKINEPEYTLDRYLSLGIYEGARLTVFMKSGKNIIVRVGNTKIAFTGRSAANVICCEESNME